eukprot:4308429-Alexandrium_andersonii.AAC.1
MLGRSTPGLGGSLLLAASVARVYATTLPIRLYAQEPGVASTVSSAPDAGPEPLRKSPGMCVLRARVGNSGRPHFS